MSFLIIFVSSFFNSLSLPLFSSQLKDNARNHTISPSSPYMTSGALAMLPSTEVAVIVAVPWEIPVTRPEGSFCWGFEEEEEKKRRRRKEMSFFAFFFGSGSRCCYFSLPLFRER